MPQKKFRSSNICGIATGGQGHIQNTNFLYLVLSQQNNKSPQFQIPDALWRYKKLLHLFKRSLENIKKMGMRKELETVNTDDWHQLFNKTQQLVHVSFIL